MIGRITGAIEYWLTNTVLAGADGGGERGDHGGLAQAQVGATGVGGHYEMSGGAVWYL